MKKVLLLNDNKTGHFNQTLAVSYALEELFDCEVEILEIKLKKPMKYLLRFILNSKLLRKSLKCEKSLKFIKLFYELNKPLKGCDIIVSSGRETSYLNVWLKYIFKSKNIFIGNPKKLDDLLFDYILSVLKHGYKNEIELNVAPTLPFRGDLNEFCDKFGLKNGGEIYYVLLIGGNGAGYEYNEKEYDRLIRFVNSTPSHIKWLVTTSRRTPLEIETKLQKEMRCEIFIAYNQNPQKVVGAFLQLCETAFVTEDSASMISEAIAFQKGVITLFPDKKSIDESYNLILDKFLSKRYIYRQSIEKLEQLKLDEIDLKTLKTNSIEEIKEKLKNKL